MEKIAIVFGCYAPMHQGHLDIILRAKKECDRVFLFVGGCEDEEDRGGDNLPLELRVRLVKRFFKGDPLVSVFEINDTKLGIDESMSDENWTIWLDYLMKVVGENTPDPGFDTYVFYCGEPPYKEQLESRGYEVVLCERENHISGTACRENPIKHWSKITREFRPYFSRNILIVGAASEGKTTLCEDIGKYFNCPVSHECARDRIADTFKAETDLNVNDFIYNIYEQNKLNKELIAKSENGIFVSDTDNMVSLMYAHQFVKRGLGKLTQKEYDNVLVPLTDAMQKTLRWNMVFMLAPTGKPYVDDGVRSDEYSSDEDRREFFSELFELCNYYGYKYEILTGNYLENFLRVRDYIRELMEAE